jgi:hypothetical protein
VSMSLSDGGEAGFEHAEDGGMRARLGGRDVDMMESPSQSSRTDDGCADDSLESGLGDIRVGEYPRCCALRILPAGFRKASKQPLSLAVGVNVVSCKRM